MYKKAFSKFLGEMRDYIVLVLSMSGYVPKHATILRTIAISFVLFFSLYLSLFQPLNSQLALIYFLVAEILYIGFIYLVLPENGCRHWFIKKWGSEEKGYLAFEAILGFLFLNNVISIAYITSSTSGDVFDFFPRGILFVIVLIMSSVGLITKILSAKVASIDIYYWKDMFLGRKIRDFIVMGPYKYFSNPMYGIGQLQSYAIALWYGSIPGLCVAALNQCLVFSFFFLEEKKFIKKVYNKNR
ncbi:MAG: methyltransferase [Patescibacteria group bacterium]